MPLRLGDGDDGDKGKDKEGNLGFEGPLPRRPPPPKEDPTNPINCKESNSPSCKPLPHDLFLQGPPGKDCPPSSSDPLCYDPHIPKFLKHHDKVVIVHKTVKANGGDTIITFQQNPVGTCFITQTQIVSIPGIIAQLLDQCTAVPII